MKLQAGKPVTGKDLIGRERELDLIMTLLRQGQSIVLIAPRRFGKTSIVLEVLDRLKRDHHFTTYIDLFAVPDLRQLSEQITATVLANKKLDKVFRKFGKNIGQVLKNIELKQVVEEFEFVLSYASPETDDWELLSESIDFIESYSHKYQKQIFCGLDEFGDISKLDGDRIVKLFRSKIQLQKNTAYIFSGSSESMMESLFLKKNSPFYRLARIIEIGFIHEDDFRKYLERTFHELNISVTDQFINSILDFSNGHPYYTQLILQQIYIRHQLSPLSFKLDLDTILEELLAYERNYLEKLWEETSKRREHRMVVLKIAEDAGSLYSRIDYKSINVSRTLKVLKGTGLIIKNSDDRYILSDPLFALWIRKRVLKTQ
jgi:AAA+ ATPase superfamily predicted ATPase